MFGFVGFAFNLSFGGYVAVLFLRAALLWNVALPARAAHKKRGDERDGDDDNGEPERILDGEHKCSSLY